MAIAMNFYYRNGNIHCMDTPGSRLRALRKLKGLSQVQLSAIVDIDQSTVSDIENNGGLSAEYMMRLCEALGSTPQYVMRGIRDDVLEQIKQLIASPIHGATTHKHASGQTPVGQSTELAQHKHANERKAKVSLVSSQPEPRVPKRQTFTFAGGAQAKPKVKNASKKSDPVRK